MKRVIASATEPEDTLTLTNVIDALKTIPRVRKKMIYHKGEYILQIGDADYRIDVDPFEEVIRISDLHTDAIAYEFNSIQQMKQELLP